MYLKKINRCSKKKRIRPKNSLRKKTIGGMNISHIDPEAENIIELENMILIKQSNIEKNREAKESFVGVFGTPVDILLNKLCNIVIRETIETGIYLLNNINVYYGQTILLSIFRKLLREDKNILTNIKNHLATGYGQNWTWTKNIREFPLDNVLLEIENSEGLFIDQSLTGIVIRNGSMTNNCQIGPIERERIISSNDYSIYNSYVAFKQMGNTNHMDYETLQHDLRKKRPFEACIDLLHSNLDDILSNHNRFLFSGISWHTSQYHYMDGSAIVGTGQPFHRDTRLPSSRWRELPADELIWDIYQPITVGMCSNWDQSIIELINQYLQNHEIFKPETEQYETLNDWLITNGYNDSFTNTRNGDFYQGGNPTKLLKYLLENIPLILRYCELLTDPFLEPQSIIVLNYLSVSNNYSGGQWEGSFLGEQEDIHNIRWLRNDNVIHAFPTPTDRFPPDMTTKCANSIIMTDGSQLENTVFNDRIFYQPRESSYVAFADTHWVHRRANELRRIEEGEISPRIFFASVLVGFQMKNSRAELLNQYIYNPIGNRIWKHICLTHGSIMSPIPNNDGIPELDNSISGKYNMSGQIIDTRHDYLPHQIAQLGGATMVAHREQNPIKFENNFKLKNYTTNRKKSMNKTDTINGTHSNELYKQSRELLTEHYNILIDIRNSRYIEHLQKENNLDALMPDSSKNIRKKTEEYFRTKIGTVDLNSLLKRKTEIEKRLQEIGADSEIYEMITY